MAKFYSEKHSIELELKPLEIRDHLCGRFIDYKALLNFETGTSVALPNLFDDGNLQKMFADSLENKLSKSTLCYNNSVFSYLNEPIYTIKLNCCLQNLEITQPSLFADSIFGFEQPCLFNKSENIIEFEVTIKKTFKANSYWEDLIDYVITQQGLAKIVNSRTQTKVTLKIENGSLDNLLHSHETINQEMTVCTILNFSQNLEDFRTSIFQLKDEIENLSPTISTFIENDSKGEKSFDLGPETKPFVDTRRLKRIEDLNRQLDEIFSLPKAQQKQSLREISAYTEYLISEEIRKKLINIFSKLCDQESIMKAIQNASEKLYSELPENINTDEELVSAIMSNKKVSKYISAIALNAKSAKTIISVLNRLSTENSLKKLIKTIFY